MHLTPRLVFFLVLPPLLWAGNAVVGRLAIGSMDPLWLNAVRWMLAFVLLLPLGWRALVHGVKAEAPAWASTLPQLPRLHCCRCCL